MSALWWISSDRRLGEAPFTLSQFRLEMSMRLREAGYLDVVANELEVAGGKDGCWVSMAHFFKGGSTGDWYWEVIMCVADSADEAKRHAEEVRAIASWDWRGGR